MIAATACCGHHPLTLSRPVPLGKERALEAKKGATAGVKRKVREKGMKEGARDGCAKRRKKNLAARSLCMLRATGGMPLKHACAHENRQRCRLEHTAHARTRILQCKLGWACIKVPV